MPGVGVEDSEFLEPIAVDGLFNPFVDPGVSSPLFNFEPVVLLGVAAVPFLPIAVDGL